jgi:hypothetical protein
MAKYPKVALAAAIIASFLAGQAQALTLTNRDAVDQRLQISEGGDETVTYEVVITAHQMLDELCQEGCTIALESGEQESFEGHEEVEIANGRFVIDGE